MGTPDFAVQSLIALQENDYQVVGVVTQPDRRKGRGQKLAFSPVKEKALEYGLSVYQPESVNTPEFLTLLEKISPQLIVVTAFGQLLGRKVLAFPPLGCINVHGSLLPQYRGAAPLQRAIMEGKKETGITIMYMAEKLDAGDMLWKEKVAIEPNDTLGVLHDKMAKLGGKALLKVLSLLTKGSLPREEQEEELVTYAEKINKKEVEIDWKKEKETIRNLVRGSNPWPGAYTYLKDKLWKIWSTSLSDQDLAKSEPGSLMIVDGRKLLVATGDGWLELLEIQPENSKKMLVADYLKGHRIEDGAIFSKRCDDGD